MQTRAASCIARKLSSIAAEGKQIGIQKVTSQAQDHLDSIIGSCLLERLPIVIPEDEDWELEYEEARRVLYEKYTRPLPEEFNESEASIAEWEQEGWEPEPRVTEADHSNDTQSLRRKLDRRLILMVKAEGSGEQWTLPKALNRANETIRSTAERALHTSMDTGSCQVFFVGHAPCAHYNIHGQTHFINKAQLIDGIPALPDKSKYADFAWLCREEVLDSIQDNSLRELFSKLIPSSL